MPRRRQKRTETQNSDDFQQKHAMERTIHFGTVRFNRMLAPDQIEGDDTSKYSILAWSNTLYAQRLLPWIERKQLFKRALSFLPYSYKIWHMYLSQFIDYCSNRSLQSKQWGILNSTFQQALTKLPRMPRIWIMYSETLQKQHMIKRTRQIYNWSFRNLPLTQHQKIWQKFTKWAMKLDNTSTAIHIIPRYLKINPDYKQTYAEYLMQKNLFDQSVKIYKQILEDDGYHSKAGKDKKQFYFQVINLITEYPDKIKCLDSYQFIRDALKLYPEEEGRIWVKLADYQIRLGQFDKARKQYEQAIESVGSAKDFGIIFSAYVKFQQQMVTALASNEIRTHYEIIKEDNVDEQIQARLKGLQTLLNRQPQLLLNISIRKNPNQISPWLGLVSLFRKANKNQKALETIQRALQTINPQLAQGKLSEVWIQYSRILQQSGQIKRCNQVLYNATQTNFKMMEDSLSIWRRWAEMLMEQNYYEDALKVIKQVLFKKRTQTDSKSKQMEDYIKNHATLWQLYIDLQINLGDFSKIKSAFDRCKQHKSLTPLMLLNYTNFLWSQAYFEETFRVFQFALSNFSWPSLYEIWLAYIKKFIARHSVSPAGVQRARSMFQRLLKEVPKQKALIFYFLYAQFQEEYGLYSHCVEIFDKMVKAVPMHEKFTAYSIYISKVAKLLGVTKTRPVFQSSLQNLKQVEVLSMGRKYAQLEINLGQIDRARGIMGHISQFCDPRDDTQGLWRDWQKFQIEYGDKQSYKQFMRIKRSVEAKYVMLPPDLQKIQANIKKGLA